MKKYSYIFLILFLLIFYCDIMDPLTTTGSMVIQLKNDNNEHGLQKQMGTLISVQCIVKKGSKTVQDKNLIHSDSSFTGTIDNLETGVDYSVELYGKNSNGEAVVEGSQEDVTIRANETTTVLIAWLGKNLTCKKGEGNSLTPTTVIQGNTFTKKMIVKNTGELSSGSFKLYVYLSDNNHFEETVDEKVGESYVSSIASGSEEDVETTCTVPSDLTPGEYYVYTKIDAEDDVVETNEEDNVSYFSSTNLLTVEPPIGTPSLKEPLNGELTDDDRPWIDWDAVSGTSGYELQVDNDSDFSSPEYEKSNIGYSSHTLEESLLLDTYYWRVRAVNSAGTPGEWSNSGVFKVNILDLDENDFTNLTILNDSYILGNYLYTNWSGDASVYINSSNHIVLEDFYDDGSAEVYIKNIPYANNLTVEFEWRVSRTNADFGFQMWDFKYDNSEDWYEVAVGPNIEFDDGGNIEAHYYSGTTGNYTFHRKTILNSYKKDVYYKIKLEIDVIHKNYDIWVNGAFVTSNCSFSGNSVEYLDRLRFIAYSNRTCGYAILKSIVLKINEYSS